MPRKRPVLLQKGNQEKYFESITECADYLQVNVSTLIHNLNLKNTYHINQWVVSYAKKDEAQRYQYQNLDSGQIYDSAVDAANSINVYPSGFYRATTDTFIVKNTRWMRIIKAKNND